MGAVRGARERQARQLRDERPSEKNANAPRATISKWLADCNKWPSGSAKLVS